jgi:hypothetical protein
MGSTVAKDAENVENTCSPFLLDVSRYEESVIACNTIFVFRVSLTGRPDWANFRPLDECFLQIMKVVYILGYSLPRFKVMHLF